MADLGIFVKTVFEGKGFREAKKAAKGLGEDGKKAAGTYKDALGRLRDENGRFVKSSKKGLEGLKSSFGGIKKTTKDVFSNLSPAALAGPAAAIAALAAGMVSLAASSLKLAEEARSVRSAFNSLSGGASIAVANMEAMRIATKGLVSETEQMRIANQLLGMNIVSTADQLEEVVGVSRRLGKEFRGLGAKEAAEEFAIMIANMSVARLDSFGLSSGKVRERINELMRTTEGMTREAAFFQATMEEGQKTISRLGPELNTTADETAKLSAEWANFQAILGETAEETGILKGMAKGLSDNLILLQSWSDAGADVAKNQQALEIQIARTEKAIDNNSTGWIKNSAAAKRNLNKLAELGIEYNAVTKQIKANTAAAKEQQEAMEAVIRSEEIAAKNLAKREAAAKKLAQIQEQFAKDVIAIQGETEESLLDSQEQFDDDSLKNTEDHAKSIANIQKKFAKGESNAAKKLQKDLTKIDTNLKKSLEKQTKDEGKKIAKAQADFAKDDRTSQKRKQIDSLADERLFQFELRNLAADGQGIAIKEALERRAIEGQIASEKAEFEKSVEQDKRKDQIQSLRDEGQEARSQLGQQATERKADLELRNQEAMTSRAERLQEELIQEAEGFAQKKVDLQKSLDERNEDIKQSERDKIEAIAKGLAETEDLTNESLDRMVALAGEFGEDFGQVFADGVTKAVSEALKIEQAIEDSGGGFGASTGNLPISTGIEGKNIDTTGGKFKQTGSIGAFQTGGILGSDGVFFGHKNEEIANPSIGQAITINGETFAVRAAGEMANAINGAMQANAQMIVDTVAANL